MALEHGCARSNQAQQCIRLIPQPTWGVHTCQSVSMHLIIDENIEFPVAHSLSRACLLSHSLPSVVASQFSLSPKFFH